MVQEIQISPKTLRRITKELSEKIDAECLRALDILLQWEFMARGKKVPS